jgi:hypothetical protein
MAREAVREGGREQPAEQRAVGRAEGSAAHKRRQEDARWRGHRQRERREQIQLGGGKGEEEPERFGRRAVRRFRRLLGRRASKRRVDQPAEGGGAAVGVGASALASREGEVGGGA